MPILNYTTDVPASKSVGQIIALLSTKGALSISQEFYGDGRCKAVAFTMQVGQFPVLFKLPVNIDGVAAVLMKEKPYSKYNTVQNRDEWEFKKRQEAERISWRILKDWVEAQVALIESGQVEPAQPFLPYAQQADGRTMYELFVESKQKLLPVVTQ